jgi:hypothetical protein
MFVGLPMIRLTGTTSFFAVPSTATKVTPRLLAACLQIVERETSKFFGISLEVELNSNMFYIVDPLPSGFVGVSLGEAGLNIDTFHFYRGTAVPLLSMGAAIPLSELQRLGMFSGEKTVETLNLLSWPLTDNAVRILTCKLAGSFFTNLHNGVKHC